MSDESEKAKYWTDKKMMEYILSVGYTPQMIVEAIKKMEAGEPESRNKMSDKIENLVRDLTNKKEWYWGYMISREDAAHEFLLLLAAEGLIDSREHPLGGAVWRVNGKLYGRTDDVDSSLFEPKPTGKAE